MQLRPNTAKKKKKKERKSLKIINAGEGMEKKEPSLKELKTELPHDSVIPLLGIYLEKNIIQKDACTSMFTAALIYNSQDMETS